VVASSCGPPTYLDGGLGSARPGVGRPPVVLGAVEAKNMGTRLPSMRQPDSNLMRAAAAARRGCSARSQPPPTPTLTSSKLAPHQHATGLTAVRSIGSPSLTGGGETHVCNAVRLAWMPGDDDCSRTASAATEILGFTEKLTKGLPVELGRA
jgi:hypothetical protein